MAFWRTHAISGKSGKVLLRMITGLAQTTVRFFLYLSVIVIVCCAPIHCLYWKNLFQSGKSSKIAYSESSSYRDISNMPLKYM